MFFINTSISNITKKSYLYLVMSIFILFAPQAQARTSAAPNIITEFENAIKSDSKTTSFTTTRTATIYTSTNGKFNPKVDKENDTTIISSLITIILLGFLSLFSAIKLQGLNILRPLLKLKSQ